MYNKLTIAIFTLSFWLAIMNKAILNRVVRATTRTFKCFLLRARDTLAIE